MDKEHYPGEYKPEGSSWERAADDYHTVIDDSGLGDLQKQQKGAAAVIWVFILIICAGAIWWYISSQPDPTDQKMRVQAAQLEKAVMRYHADEADYPYSLEEASHHFPTAGIWPVEPYNGKRIADTGSDEFDPATSVGMVHYVRLETDSETGYRITVFGRDGILETRWGGYVTGS